ncbi:putative uridylyltransferase [bacterium HR36]|nr:putative uridylyltransferase [bacterium HR36]
MTSAILPDGLYQRLRERLEPFGQEHVLRWWSELDEVQRAELAAEVERCDWAELDRLFRGGQNATCATVLDWQQVQPPKLLRLANTFEAWELEQKARAVGEEALRNGQVAVALVAGGHGSRLGHEGPKGTFPIGPIIQRSLFQLHAEKVLALSRRYRAPLPWYIMTSPDNDAPTRRFFAEHNYFGLEPQQVTFFTQGTMPALDKGTGRVLMRSKWQLALSPNGHGGFIPAIRAAGIIRDWQRRGVRWVFYFQVDNPLVRVADPLFLGQHISHGADVSVKVVPRQHAEEKVGLIVYYRGQHYLVEYSEIPAEYQYRKNPAGGFWLDAGNTGIHIFSVAFLERVSRPETRLPYHRVIKKVAYINEWGECVEPQLPNAVKWELFIFDALPLADRVLVVQTDRAEEFAPLKNAVGEDSPETVRAALIRLYARWLEQAGFQVPRDAKGQVPVSIEISPLVALDAGDLRGRVEEIDEINGQLLLDRVPNETEAESP